MLGLGRRRLTQARRSQAPSPFLACHSPAVPWSLAAGSPAAVLSLPTGVLEQLRSMVDDSEDTAPGLQPV